MFSTDGDLIKFYARAPAQAAAVEGPDGASLRKRDEACSADRDRRQYTWAFELRAPPREGDVFTFRSEERVVLGQVMDDGRILEVAAAPPLSHNEVFGGRSVFRVENRPTRNPPRQSAESLAEVASRHAASRLEREVPAHRGAYETVVTAPAGTWQVGPKLSEVMSRARGTHEVEEVYARVYSAYEPLRGEHLAEVGELAVVLRARHPIHPPRVVGIMMAKDEADAVTEVVAPLRHVLERLYYVADDATAAAVEAASSHGWARRTPTPASTSDGTRRLLLDRARADRGDDPRPTWVLVVQGDEVYDADLRAHVLLAQAERATVMAAQVATFVLHESQREGWDWTLPLPERLTHYVWDFGEHAGFLDFPWVHYREGEHMRAHPHGLYPARYARARPVRRHYPFRTPEQARARIEDRIKSGWQPHYRHYEGVFMRGEAAGLEIKRYWRWFPEAERVDGIW